MHTREDAEKLYTMAIPGYPQLCIDAYREGNITRFIAHAPSILELKMFVMSRHIREQVATENVTEETYISSDRKIGVLFQTIRRIRPGAMVKYSYSTNYFIAMGVLPLLYNEEGLPLDMREVFLDKRRYFIISILTHLIDKSTVIVDDITRSMVGSHPIVKLVMGGEAATNRDMSFDTFEAAVKKDLESFNQLLMKCYRARLSEKKPEILALYKDYLEKIVFLKSLILNPHSDETHAAIDREFLNQAPNTINNPHLFQILRPESLALTQSLVDKVTTINPSSLPSPENTTPGPITKVANIPPGKQSFAGFRAGFLASGSEKRVTSNHNEVGNLIPS